ncbi:MAG: hypothetical protein KAR47_18055, partial [Planctomycetes bacterium]|nr:hypothetical protein [Planctomycetota bacterium]
LDRVMIYANRSETDAAKIRAEQQDHLLKKIEELQADGLEGEDAVSRAIEDHGDAGTVGYGLRPRFPWVDVRTKGTARGFIAIGPRAKGVIAIGGVAYGVFAIGGVAFGILSNGVFALGMIIGLGVFAFVPVGLAYGIIAVGLMSAGVVSVGIVAMGELAVGLLTLNRLHGGVISYFTPDNVPHFIESISENMMTGWFPSGLLGSFWIGCIVLLAVELVLFRRERRRVENADVSVVE